MIKTNGVFHLGGRPGRFTVPRLTRAWTIDIVWLCFIPFPYEPETQMQKTIRLDFLSFKDEVSLPFTR